MVEIINNIAKIGNHYLMYLNQKLDHGAFGEIYLGKSLRSNEDVAIKLEPVTNQHPQLFHENKVYNHLNTTIGVMK